MSFYCRLLIFPLNFYPNPVKHIVAHMFGNVEGVKETF